MSGRSVRLIGTPRTEAARARCCYFHRLGWARGEISTGSPLSCRRQASCCHCIPGKVAGRSFPWVQQAFFCVSGSRGGGGGGVGAVCVSLKLESVLSCAGSLTSNFFFFFFPAAAVLFIPSSLLADFPFKPLPHLRVAVLLMWKFFFCSGEDVCFSLFCPCALAVGTFLRSLLHSACSFHCLDGDGNRVGFFFFGGGSSQESVCLPNVNYIAACWSKN